jgi:hypothetical protein
MPTGLWQRLLEAAGLSLGGYVTGTRATSGEPAAAPRTHFEAAPVRGEFTLIIPSSRFD